MGKITYKEKLELKGRLELWFNEISANPHRWSRDPVGNLIRERLKRMDNWKAAGRGDPKKGYLMQKERRDREAYEE